MLLRSMHVLKWLLLSIAAFCYIYIYIRIYIYIYIYTFFVRCLCSMCLLFLFCICWLQCLRCYVFSVEPICPPTPWALSALMFFKTISIPHLHMCAYCNWLFVLFIVFIVYVFGCVALCSPFLCLNYICKLILMFSRVLWCF